MKYILSFLAAFALLAPSAFAGEPTPISIGTLPEAPIYAAFVKNLQTGLVKGPDALAAIRRLNTQIGSVNETVSKTVSALVDPKDEYNGENKTILDFLDVNRWAGPIFQYTNGDDSDEKQIYDLVNHELRDGGLSSKRAKTWAAGMKAAWPHLPRFEGISFRGTRLLSNRADKYYPAGMPANDNAYISTSVMPETAFKFAKPGVNGPEDKLDKQKIAIIFVTEGKSGRPVSYFAFMHAHEEEILFLSGTPMTVTAKSPVFTDAELGKTQIILLTEK